MSGAWKTVGMTMTCNGHQYCVLSSQIALFLTFYVFGSCFRILAVIHISDFCKILKAGNKTAKVESTHKQRIHCVSYLPEI